MEYKNSDLTKNIDAKGYDYEYTYDDNHNVTKIESQTYMNYNYTYAKGLATSLEVKCGSKVTDVGILKSEVTYDSNGLLSSATDQDGNKVEYKYDGNKGTLTQTTDKLDSKNPVVTDYTYDSNTEINSEISWHYRAYYLRILVDHANPADLGSTDKKNSGYDSNAWIFEPKIDWGDEKL